MLYREWLYTVRNLRALAISYAISAAFALTTMVDVDSENSLRFDEVNATGGTTALIISAWIWPIMSERLFVDFTSGTATLFLRACRRPLDLIVPKLAIESVLAVLITSTTVALLASLIDGARYFELVTFALLAPLVTISTILLALTALSASAVRRLALFVAGATIPWVSMMDTPVYTAFDWATVHLFPPFTIGRIAYKLVSDVPMDASLWIAAVLQVAVMLVLIGRRVEDALLRSNRWTA